MRVAVALPEALLDHADRRGGCASFTQLEYPSGSSFAPASRFLTFAELALQMEATASTLRRSGVRQGDVVVLALGNTVETVIGLLGVLRLGAVAALAPLPEPARPARHARRLTSIWGNSSPKCVVSSPEGWRLLEAYAPGPWLDNDRRVVLGPAQASDAVVPAPPVEIEGSDLAILQYSSGSTAEPKGVMLTHANLLAACDQAIDAYGDHGGDTTVTWVPLHHDMGLVTGVLRPIIAGHHSVLMSPTAFVQVPARWLAAIAGYRASLTSAPDFAYALCARRLPRDVAKSLDLSCLRVARCAAEPVRMASIEAFCAATAASGFDPGAFCASYGLAEATLTVSTRRPGQGPAVMRAPDQERHRQASSIADWRLYGEPVSCGRPLAGTTVEIVDPTTGQPSAPGTIGEIWVAGPQVASGYLGDAELSAEVFGARLPGRSDTFMRTGDLGIVLDDEVAVVGRIKETLLLHGEQHFSQDLEVAIEQEVSAVRPGGCVICQHRGTGVLVLAELAEPDHAGSHERVVGAIRSALAATCGASPTEVVLLLPGNLPKTSSGKRQRRLAADLWLDGSMACVHAWKSRQEVLV